MTSQPATAFFESFADPVVSAFTDALRRAYDTACEKHEPRRGSNEQTFGFDIYHFGAFELEQEAERVVDIAVEAGRPYFRLRVGEFTVACHRVGRSAAQDITQCFPTNDGAAPALIERQLWLPGMEPRVDEARNLVLAHLGNPEMGLEAVYLCIPSREEKGRIADWGYTHPIWTIGDGTVARPRPTPTSLAPEEVIDEPIVRRKAREEGA